jgi:hypothetical protein
MSQTLKGKATYHSFIGAVSFSAIITNGLAEPIGSHTFTRRADIQERVNANEELVGYKGRNHRWEVTVTCLCSTADFPATNANADALKAALLPLEVSVVALSTFAEATRTGNAATYGCPTLNGDYVYVEGGTVEMSAEWYKITLPLKKYDHQTAANLTKAVT